MTYPSKQVHFKKWNSFMTRCICGILMLATISLYAASPIGPTNKDKASKTPKYKTEGKPGTAIQLLDVSTVRPEKIYINRAHWTHGTAGIINDRGRPLAAQDSMSLLSEDPAKIYNLPLGDIQAILDFGEYYTLKELIFASLNAKGNLDIDYANPTSTTEKILWKPLVRNEPYEKKQDVEIPLKDIEVRLVRLTFHTIHAGQVANFTILGSQGANIKEGAADPDEVGVGASSDQGDMGVSERNLAALHRGAQVTGISSGSPESAATMIDNDYRTGHAFDTSDKTPVFITRLPKEQDINKISVHGNSKHSGSIELYVVNELPKGSFEEIIVETDQGPVKKIVVSEEFFEKNEPVHQEDVYPQSDWRVSHEFQAQPGQYVIARWVPHSDTPTPNDPLVIKQVYVTKTFSLEDESFRAIYARMMQSLISRIFPGGLPFGGGLAPRLPDVSQ